MNRRRLAAVLVVAPPLLAALPTGGVGPTLCLQRLLFHVPCAGCGLTRAFRAAVRGDFAGALRAHPGWWAAEAALLLAALLLVVDSSPARAGRPLLARFFARPAFAIALVAASLAAIPIEAVVGRGTTGVDPVPPNSRTRSG